MLIWGLLMIKKDNEMIEIIESQELSDPAFLPLPTKIVAIYFDLEGIPYENEFLSAEYTEAVNKPLLSGNPEEG